MLAKFAKMKFSISQMILVSFSVLLVPLAIIWLVQVWQISSAITSLSNETNTMTTEMAITNDIQVAAMELVVAQRRYLFFGASMVTASDYVKDMETQTRALELNLNQLGRLALSPAEATQRDTVRKNYRDLKETFSSVVNMQTTTEGRAKADQLMKDKEQALFQAVGELDHISRDNLTSELNARSTGLRNIAIVSIIVMLVVYAVSVVGSFAIARSAFRTLPPLVTLAEAVAAGDLRQQVKPEGVTEARKLAGSINSMVDHLRNIAAQLQITSLTVSEQAVQVSATASQQSAGAVQSAAAVTEVTTTIEELARSAAQIRQSMEDAQLVAERGQNATSDSLSEAEETRMKVEAVAQRILALGEKSQRIGEINDLISDVASKTHLLALNAAIESASAGEYGRRFAVVASQVKDLSDETRLAANQVKASIAEIQTAINSSVMAAENAAKEVENSSALAQATGVVIEEMVDKIRVVALASEQQQQASEAIVQTMREIATVAKDSASSSQKANSSAGHLAASAEALRSLSGHFTLE